MNTCRLEQAYPDANKGLGVNLVPLQLQHTGSNVRLALWMLFGAVVLVLLIACTNVANLMLARGIAREREMAIRMALGAGRWRLIRQLLPKARCWFCATGGVGLLIASWGIGPLSLSANLPRLDGVAMTPKDDLNPIVYYCRPAVAWATALKISQTTRRGVESWPSASGGIRGAACGGYWSPSSAGSDAAAGAACSCQLQQLQAVVGFDPHGC